MIVSFCILIYYETKKINIKLTLKITIVSIGVKLGLLISLVDEFKANGEQTLIFRYPWFFFLKKNLFI